MAFRGERFVLDLDDEDGSNPPVEPSPPPAISLIGEIHERAPSAAVPPAPKPPTGVGFPQHRRRTKPSSFKQRRENQSEPVPSSQSDNPPQSTPRSPPTLSDEKKAIDEENRRQLDSMSASQIQYEREELMSSMGSSLLEKFLRRAKVDDDDSSQKEPQLQPSASSSEEAPPKPKKSVSFDDSKSFPTPEPAKSSLTPKINEDLPPAQPPSDLHPASELPPSDTFHFPTPPRRQNAVPNLDPSSPSFLSDLQTHYFPDMPHDPSALSWLQPPSSDPEDPDSTSPYHPASEAASMPPSAIRFSLLGTILSPSTSLSLPTNLGLHHHGNDPQAAGYTIPELAILGRSSFPAQRCIAWQVLGRLLLRLGKGEFGERGSTLVEGLWFVIEKEKILGAMVAEADGAQQAGTRRDRKDDKDDGESESRGGMPGGFGRHASATAWAVEGVWLWQMGGGGDRGLLKDGVIRSQ